MTKIQFRGVPGSPYTRKMLAYLRYRHIAYEFLIGDSLSLSSLPKPKVNLLPTFYLPNAQGDIEAVVDSTPIIRRFEQTFNQRLTIPDHPVLAFVNYLIEDYADEWLTKPMFHYRWNYQEDIAMASKILPRWRYQQQPEETLQQAGQMVAERQISRLYVVGSNEHTAEVIEESYQGFLKLFNQLIRRQPFLLGERPASADFAVYAQLTQLVKFDPTPQAICLEQAPSVYAWTDVLDDLSGYSVDQKDWLNLSEVKAHLAELLAEVGRVYTPVLLANAHALAAGEKNIQTEISGKLWQQPTFPYQGKCLQNIRHEYQQLSKDDQAAVMDILQDTGCEPLVSQAP